MIIKEIILNGGRKRFDLKCESSGKLFSRIKNSGEKISNTEKKLCDEEIIKFKNFIKEKGYIISDCWCKHLQEYINTE